MTKMKKVLVWVVLLALMLPVLASTIPAAYAWGSSEMYVKTSNGKSVTVRAEPSKKAKSVGKVKYRQKVTWDWDYSGNDGWSKIQFGSKTGFIQSKYLVAEDPGPYVKPTKSPEEKQAELNKELKSEKEVGPFYIEVRTSRSTGTANFRVGPSTITSKITAFTSGKELIAVGETNNWWRVKDPDSGKTGYISKSLTAKINKQVVLDEPAEGEHQLGKLSVNGEFDLTCKLPKDYKLQVVSMRGESIVASITSDDITKPEMYLSIAYDELYGEVDRMNDLSQEDLEVLERSFTDEHQVQIEYRETGYGTKLLVAREVGPDPDFVTFLSIYKGYFVEFTLTPSSKVADQTLTEEQIRMCIDFLTDVDFIPVA